MKIGLIARAEYARGLAIQTRNFYENMPVDRVLLVTMPRPDCDTDPSWCRSFQEVVYNDIDHTLAKNEVMDWMAGLDVVFTVETTYDWQLPNWAREIGVKTVVQGNPEFYRHGTAGYWDLAHPDEWWWPTSWRTDLLPPGPIMPVPMPDRPNVARKPGEKPHFLHVVGKRAYADRNGTDIIMDSLRAVQAEVDFTISGFGWELPEITAPSNVNLTVERAGVHDRWTMYDDKSILLLPRRYGGLCLPALEAAACGVGVVMTDVQPNAELAAGLLPCRQDRVVRMAAGKIAIADMGHIDMAGHIDGLAGNERLIDLMQIGSQQKVSRWDTMRDEYLAELERVVDGYPHRPDR